MTGDHRIPERLEGRTVRATTPAPPSRGALLSRPSSWLWIYGTALALIAFWPEHVDKHFSPLLVRIIDIVPLLTYERLEFGANIVMFIPLGALLATLLRRRSQLALPIAFLCSVVIEGTQALLLDQRTPSIYDIIANTAGACIGIVLVAIAQRSESTIEA